MACFYPWSKVVGGHSRLFACGKCHGCRLEHSRQWGVRCMHEASLHEQNCFITLTYAKDCWSLEYSDFQLFMKRLRARFPRVRLSFYMAGEYGELNSRAHFHACLFGFDFPDKVYLRLSPSGMRLYRSAILEQLWPHGFSSIGSVTFESAAYVARYCMKKVSGDGPHEIIDPDTGEVFRRTKEFARMSLRCGEKGKAGGIGKRWLERFRSDVYPGGKVVVNAVEARAPRYYDKLYRKMTAAGYMRLCVDRAKDSGLVFRESLPGRLEARAAVSKARIDMLKRTVD